MVLHKAPVLSHWCIWHKGTTPYTCHVTNVEVRATTGCCPLSQLVTDRRLRLFGHTARSSPQEDHHRAVAAVIRWLPPDWKRPLGRPIHTWLRAVEADLGQQNIGLASAWRKAAIRDDWRRIVDTGTLQRSTLWKKKVPFLYPTNSQIVEVIPRWAVQWQKTHLSARITYCHCLLY